MVPTMYLVLPKNPKGRETFHDPGCSFFMFVYAREGLSRSAPPFEICTLS